MAAFFVQTLCQLSKVNLKPNFGISIHHHNLKYTKWKTPRLLQKQNGQ